jgi:hypothetical protein
VGIDVHVTPLKVALAGATKAHEPFYFSAGHLVELGEPFDYRGWREKLRALPRGEDGPFAVLTQFFPGVGKLGPRGIARATTRFQRELSERLGVPVAWDDAAHDGTEVGFDGQYIGKLDPNGMLQLFLVVAGVLGEGLSSERLAAIGELDPPPDDAAFRAATERVRELAPQFSLIDIENLLLPVDAARPLRGLPYNIGSAPALERELLSIAKALTLEVRTRSDGASLRGDAAKLIPGPVYNLEILLSGTVAARKLELPMFVDG